MAIPVKLPVFEGPLDLLMHLIEKNKIDIYDIPIVEITDQYLEYVHQMDREDMDVTSEFLVMAATLLDIKSRMLLPREKDEENGEEAADPREELVQRLLEYKMYKYLSEELAVRREETGVRYFRAQNLPKEVRSYQPPIDYGELLHGTDLQSLQKVFGEVLRRKKSRRDPIRSGFGKIKREQVSIDAKTLYIRAYLQTHPRTDFRALLESQESREEVIVTFLILLELMKTQKVYIVQDSIGGKILVESNLPEKERAEETESIPSAESAERLPATEDPERQSDDAACEPDSEPALEPAAPAPKEEVPAETLSEASPAYTAENLSVRTPSSTSALNSCRNTEIFSAVRVDWVDTAEHTPPETASMRAESVETGSAMAPQAGTEPADTLQVDTEPADTLQVDAEPADTLQAEAAPPAAAPVSFSARLWQGGIRQGAEPGKTFTGRKPCCSPALLGLTGWASGPDRIRIRRALWEQDRMSRLWACRPSPRLPDLSGSSSDRSPA